MIYKGFIIYIPGGCLGFVSISSTVQIKTEDVGKMTKKDSEHFGKVRLRREFFESKIHLAEKYVGIPRIKSHRIHVWYVYLPTFS